MSFSVKNDRPEEPILYRRSKYASRQLREESRGKEKEPETPTQALVPHSHQPEILGREDHDPFTRPRQPGLADFLPNNWVVPTRKHRPDPGAVQERFMEAYGYRFDRHGKLKFP